jgi:DNA-binding Lrp family transcriptional regulator
MGESDGAGRDRTGMGRGSGSGTGDGNGPSRRGPRAEASASLRDAEPAVLGVSRGAPTQANTRTGPAALDALDRQLLVRLQANARASTADLARGLGVARTTVVARLARLERQGVVLGYTVKLGDDAADTGLQAFVGITVQPRAGRDVVRQLQRMPEVRQLSAVSGEFDYVALLRAATPARLDGLLDDIGAIEGVHRTTTSVVLARRIDRL